MSETLNGFKRFLHSESKKPECDSIDGDGELENKTGLDDDLWPKMLNCMLQDAPLNKLEFGKLDVFLDQKFVLESIEGILNAATEFSSAKDSSKSAEYRRLGNDALSENQFEDASFLFTLSILYAPNLKKTFPEVPEVSPLALAHEKRSEVFFKLGQWHNSLVDINLALEAGYNEHPSVRQLMIRKVECLISLGCFTEARRLWAQDPFLTNPSLCSFEDDRAQTRRLEYIDFPGDFKQESMTPNDAINPLMETVISLANAEQYAPSTNLASLSAKVKVTKSECISKVTSDVPAGDILAIELPYLTALYKSQELSFCHHCCRRLEVASKSNSKLISGPIVACITCTRVLYCTPSCRALAWDIYHRYECSILPVLYQTGIGHLAFRIVVSTGLDTIRKVAQDEGTGPYQLQDATDVVSLYKQLYNMAISAKPPTNDWFKYSITTSLLVQLAKQIELFKDASAHDIELLGHSILRHMFQLRANGRQVSSLTALNTSECFQETPIAEAMYPITSLMNRSDNPNVLVTFVQGSRMIVRASRKLSAGEELLMPSGVQRIRKPEECHLVHMQSGQIEEPQKHVSDSGIPLPSTERAHFSAQMSTAVFRKTANEYIFDMVDRLCECLVEELDHEEDYEEEPSLWLTEHIFGSASLELVCALILLSDNYYEYIQSSFKASLQLPEICSTYRHFSEQAIQLLQRFGLLGSTYRLPFSGGLLSVDSLDFFATSHRRLSMQLKLLDCKETQENGDQESAKEN